MARFYCPLPLVPGQVLDLPSTAARHVQVLRMQPGHPLTLFNGQGGEFSAQVQHMGRSEVRVVVGEHRHVECEAAVQVHLAVGMPANERMDWLVEKATELGVHRITPLMTERSVIRLTGERAEKKQAHWQAVAASASEQCGRNRVPLIDAPERLEAWLVRQQAADSVGDAVCHAVLSLHASTQALQGLMRNRADLAARGPTQSWVVLSGPEGGLSDAEDAKARLQGFTPVTLGPRVLRAETAALAALAWLTLA
jgi:16S rRNA (uracil1498-N3)-methyltransferase